MPTCLNANNTEIANPMSPSEDVIVDASLSTSTKNPTFKENARSSFQQSGPQCSGSFDVTSRLVEFRNSNQVEIMSNRNSIHGASRTISSKRQKVDENILSHASWLTTLPVLPSSVKNPSVSASFDANSTEATNERSPNDNVMVDAILPINTEKPQLGGNTTPVFQHSNHRRHGQQSVPHFCRSFNVTGRLVDPFSSNNRLGITSSRNAKHDDASKLISFKRPQVDKSILNRASCLSGSHETQIDQRIFPSNISCNPWQDTSHMISSGNPKFQSGPMSCTNVMQIPSQSTSSPKVQVEHTSIPSDIVSDSQSRNHLPRDTFEGNFPLVTTANQLDGSLVNSGFEGNASIGQSYGDKGVMHPANLRLQTAPAHGKNYVQSVPTFDRLTSVPNPSARFQTTFHSNQQAVTTSNNTDYVMVSSSDKDVQVGRSTLPSDLGSDGQSGNHWSSARAVSGSNKPLPTNVNWIDETPLKSQFGGKAAIDKSYGYRDVKFPTNLRLQTHPAHGHNSVHLVPTCAMPAQSDRFQTAFHNNQQTVTLPNSTDYVKVSPLNEARPIGYLGDHFGPSGGGSVAIPGHAISNESSLPSHMSIFGIPTSSHLKQTAPCTPTPSSFEQKQTYTAAQVRGLMIQFMEKTRHQQSTAGLQRSPSNIRTSGLAKISHDHPKQRDHSIPMPSSHQQQKTYTADQVRTLCNRLMAQHSHQKLSIDLQSPPPHISNPGLAKCSDSVPKQEHRKISMPFATEHQPVESLHIRGQGPSGNDSLTIAGHAISKNQSMASRHDHQAAFESQSMASHHDHQAHHNILIPSPIQWQVDEPFRIKGPDIFTNHIKPVGKRCEMCGRDLAFEAQGSSSSDISSGLLPTIAVLPCGHCYHDKCAKFAFGATEPYDCPPCLQCQE